MVEFLIYTFGIGYWFNDLAKSLPTRHAAIMSILWPVFVPLIVFLALITGIGAAEL